MIWLEMGGRDAPRSFLPQYEALNTKNMDPRPFRHAIIWPIFLGVFLIFFGMLKVHNYIYKVCEYIVDFIRVNSI